MRLVSLVPIFELENLCKTLFLDLETLFQHLVPIFLQLLQETLVELLLPPFGLVFDVGQSDVAQEPALSIQKLARRLLVIVTYA